MSEELNNEENIEVSIEEYLEMMTPGYLMIGDYEKEALENLLIDLNASRQVPKKIIYLDSNGGYTDFIHPIIDAIEMQPCELVATNKIYSSAFITFFAANVDKRILPDTIGMFHYPAMFSTDLNPNNTPRLKNSKLGKAILEFGYPYREYFEELLEIDKKRHKKLMDGDELVYKYKDLQKLLEKSKKILASYK